VTSNASRARWCLFAIRSSAAVTAPIAPGKLRSWLDALRDSELVPEHQDLDVFRRTRPGQQRKPSEELTRELIDQTYRHDPA
jgi:hypothetical protein